MKHDKFRNGLLTVALLVLIVSITLNIFLYARLRKYYTSLYAVELDPLGLSYYQNIFEQEKPDHELQTVVFFGDSRAAQWPSPDIDGFWFVNRGIGNQTSAQIANRFDEHVEPLQPDVILLQLGINDLKTMPLFPERKEEIISNCKLNIQQIVHRSLKLDSIVVVSTIFPIGTIPWERRLVWSNDIDRAVIEVNEYILSLSAENVIIFDAAEVLSDANGKMQQEYSYDELHLNEAGYTALNLEFVKLLDSLKTE